jgi:hypothetical protein
MSLAFGGLFLYYRNFPADGRPPCRRARCHLNTALSSQPSRSSIRTANAFRARWRRPRGDTDLRFGKTAKQSHRFAAWRNKATVCSLAKQSHRSFRPRLTTGIFTKRTMENAAISMNRGAPTGAGMTTSAAPCARFRSAIGGTRAGGTPAVPGSLGIRAGGTPALPGPYSHFIHLKKKYGSTAASSISTMASG